MEDPNYLHISEDLNIRIRKIVNNDQNVTEDKEPKTTDMINQVTEAESCNSDEATNNISDFSDIVDFSPPIENSQEKATKNDKNKCTELKKYFKTKQGSFQCIKCEKQYSTSGHVGRHYLRQHMDNISCSYCPYVAKDQYRLNDHIHFKHANKKFQCKFCTKGFQNELGFGAHISKVHNIFCNKCDKTFITALHLGRHLKIDHKEAVFNCTHCSYATKYEHLFEIHLNRMHLGKAFKCELCHMSFQKEKDQVSHITKAHDQSCFQCPRVFALRKQLDLHIQIDHEHKENLHFCKICNKRYLNLDKHVEVIHQSTDRSEACKTYPCQHCNIKFKSKYFLNKHMKDIGIVVRYF